VKKKKIKVKNGRIINIPNDEELSTAITIDVFCAFVFCLISLFTIFPLYKIIPGQFDLTPNGINNPYKFLNITHLKKIFILIIIYILIMSLYDYYYRHLKTKEEFKYVKSFKDLRNSCKINIVIKTIFFSLLSVIYLSHSIDTFFSGLNIPMITKKKGSILYSSNHKLFNSLHDFAISSGYPIHKGFLEEKSNTGRDVLVFKYLTETIIYEEVNMTNSSLNNNTINNNNETLNNSNNTANNTKIKKPRKKKEWKSMQFKHQINEKGNNNLYFFINILFKQPRLEYALHHLAYENNGMKNLTDKI
jgi:nitrogen fixation/metabolism regulation signal transduction histidine kinase